MLLPHHQPLFQHPNLLILVLTDPIVTLGLIYLHNTVHFCRKLRNYLTDISLYPDILQPEKVLHQLGSHLMQVLYRVLGNSIGLRVQIPQKGTFHRENVLQPLGQLLE